MFTFIRNNHLPVNTKLPKFRALNNCLNSFYCIIIQVIIDIKMIARFKT